MGLFVPLYIRRSDGKLETVLSERPIRRVEANQPTKEQFDSTPKDGVSDYYRAVNLDDTKSLDWRRKLGSMLAQKLPEFDRRTSSINAAISSEAC